MQMKRLYSMILVLVLLCSLVGISAFAEAGVTDAPTGPLPVVTKSPTDETVNEGGHAEFVARFENAVWAVWHFVSPDGETDYDYKQAKDAFEGLQIIDGNYSHMVLKKIPYALNGWKVYCEYSNNNGSVQTDSATITVIPKATPEPVPTPNPGVDASASDDINGADMSGQEDTAGMDDIGMDDMNADDMGMDIIEDPMERADAEDDVPADMLDDGKSESDVNTSSGPVVSTPKPVVSMTESSKSSVWKIIIIVLAILLVLFALWFFMLRGKGLPKVSLPALKTVKTKEVPRTKGKHEK